MRESPSSSPAAEADEDPYARREALRRGMAEHGITLHIPPPGREGRPPPVQLPFTGDELSEMVPRMRRGDP